MSCKPTCFEFATYITHVGAAKDKVAALEKAGVVVTDSPAKIGAAMLKVCSSLASVQCLCS